MEIVFPILILSVFMYNNLLFSDYFPCFLFSLQPSIATQSFTPASTVHYWNFFHIRIMYLNWHHQGTASRQVLVFVVCRVWMQGTCYVFADTNNCDVFCLWHQASFSWSVFFSLWHSILGAVFVVRFATWSLLCKIRRNYLRNMTRL